MKVLFVTNAYPSARLPWEGTFIRSQASGLGRLGMEIDVLHLQRTELGARVYLTALPRIMRRFRSGAYDIVHVHFGGAHALFGALAAGKRCIVTFRGTDLHGGSQSGAAGITAHAVSLVASRLAMRLCGRILVVSRHLLPYLGTYARNAVVIPSGVDYDMFSPMNPAEARKRLGLGKHGHYVLFCDNNNDPVKRRDLAERTVAVAAEQLPELGLLVLRHKPFSTIPAYLNASDVVLLTSDKEGSPNIVKEAIACNTPIVSVDVGDVSEMISGVRNCLLVKQDVNCLAQAVIEMIHRGERADGREKKKSLIDNRVICQKIATEYRRLLSGKK